MVRVKSPQDFWAGILFILSGSAALWIGRDYAFGTLTRMGPGYLPAVLSCALVAVGAVLTVRALALAGPAIERSRIFFSFSSDSRRHSGHMASPSRPRCPRNGAVTSGS